MVLRIVGFALGLVVSAPTLAKADDARHAAAAGIGNVLQAAAVAAVEADGAVQLQVGGALEMEQSGVRTRQAGLRQPSDTGPSTGSGSLSAGLSASWPSPGVAWFQLRASGVALPVTDRLSVSVGYRELQAESLARALALAGTLDYGSHAVFLRANWKF